MQLRVLVFGALAATTAGFGAVPIAFSQRRKSPLPLQSRPASSSGPESHESLSAIFQRAVVLQRSGDANWALEEYEKFLKAAEQLDVSPRTYAEVHVNVGAVHAKNRDRAAARRHFEEALRHREVGTALVNLAVLDLQEGGMTTDRNRSMEALKEARERCRRAVALGDDPRCCETARGLLADIEKMMQQSS